MALRDLAREVFYTQSPPVERLSAAAMIGPMFGGSPKPKSTLHAGTSQRLSRYARVNEYDPNADVRGPEWYGEPGVEGIAQKMVRDPYVRASLNYRVAPIRTSLWETIPGDDRPESVECSQFLNWNLFELLNFDRILQTGLLWHRDGFSIAEAHEEVTEIPRDRFPLHKGRGRGIVLKGLEHIPAWTVHGWQPNPANERELYEIEQHIVSSGGFAYNFHNLSVGRDLIFRITQEQEGSNYEGFPTQRSAYGSWAQKIRYILIESMKHERFGMGALIGNLPEEVEYGDDDVVEFEEFLDHFLAGSRRYLMAPHGFEVNVLETKKGEGTDIDASITRCNQDIFLNVAAHFNLLGASNFGSYALAQTISGQFGLAIQSDVKTMEGAWNHGADGWTPLHRTAKLNYPTAAPPILRARNLPIHDYLEGLKVLATLVQNRIITPDDGTEESARELLKLSKRLDNTPVSRILQESAEQTEKESPFNEGKE